MNQQIVRGGLDAALNMNPLKVEGKYEDFTEQNYVWLSILWRLNRI